MRRWLVVFAVLYALASVAGGGAATAHPRLRLLDAEPVAFKGTGFQPRERVRVVVYAGERMVKRVAAGLRGAFVVRFDDVRSDPCAAFSAVAVGSRAAGRSSSARRPSARRPKDSDAASRSRGRSRCTG